MPIHRCAHSAYTAQLILLGVVFLTTMIFDNIYSFFSHLNALHISLAPVQGFSLIVTTHNSIALNENGITEDIFYIFWWSKNFVSRQQTQNRPIFLSTIFVFLFSRLLSYTNPTILMGAKQKVLTLS